MKVLLLSSFDKQDVWLYEIIGGRHTWGNKDIDTAEEIWKFFSNFIK